MARRGQFLRAAAVGLSGGLVICLALLLYLSWTGSGRERVRRITLDALQGAIDGQVSIGRIEGNLLRRFRLVDVSIVDAEGRPFVRADTIVTRVSLLPLIAQRIRLSNVRIVRANVVLDKPPGEEWNFARILKLESDTTASGGRRWGRWVSLRGVEVVDNRFTIRTEWDASDDLTPAEQQEALAEALSPDSRENIVAVAGGYQNVMDFRQLDAGLERVVLADPDSAAMIAVVDRMSGIMEPYRPPAADVRALSGDFRLARDSLFMGDVRAELPGSRLTGEGVYSLESGELLLRLAGEPAAFADLRWLLPNLPEEGGGQVRLQVQRGSLTTRIIAEQADMRVGESHVAGHFDITLGDTVRLQDTDLRFERVDTRLVSRVVPELEPPRHGLATGHLVLAGTPSNLRVDGDVTFTEPTSGTSHVTAAGSIGVNGKVRLTDLALQFDPLQAGLARAAIDEFPARGTITGSARLNGEWLGLLDLDTDLTFRDPRAGPSRVRAVGRIDSGDENRLHDMRVTLSPLYLDILRDEVPELPSSATLTGILTLNGVPTRQLQLDGDLTIQEPKSGESRVALAGGVVTAGPLQLRRMNVRMHPLQTALVPLLGGPELPFGGVLEGTALLDGSPDGRLAFDADVVHREAGEESRVSGQGEVVAGAARRVAMDLRLDPISLVTLGRAFPGTGLQGSASGTVRLEGPLRSVAMRGQLALSGGGVISGGGSLDLESAVFAYDLDLGLQGVDLAAVTTRVGETTDLSGTLRAVGRGTELATLSSRVQADLIGSRVGDVPADQVQLSFEVADGLARFDPSLVRLETAEARVQGSFGLVEGRDGVLAYDVRVDSLHTLAPWIPGADTGLVVARPGARAQARADARADLARALRAATVERMATGVAPPAPSAVDTLPAPTLPRDSLAGSLHASGELRGNLERVDAQGTAQVLDLVYQGSSVASGSAAYQVVGICTPTPDATVTASLRDVLFRGLAYDSLELEGQYAGGRIGSGRADLTAWQDRDTELQGTAAFTFAEADRELRLEELRLRVDTVTWTNAGVGVIRWADESTEIRGLELLGSTGGRLRVDGSVPSHGQADLALLVEDLEVAHVGTILQDDLGASGRLWLDGRLRGTRLSPSFEGAASWSGAALRGTPVPDARGTLGYANSELTAEVELLDADRRLAVAQARLPLNLALSGVEGSRLLDAPLSVEVTADSLPLQGVAGLTTAITNLQGFVRGDFRVTGSFDEPVLQGGGDIVGGSLEVPALGVPFTDIAGRVSLSGDVVRIDSLVAWSRGPVRVSGVIDVATLREPRFDLLVNAREARVLDNDDGRLDVDADLSVKGPFDSVQVLGAARTRKGVLYIPPLSELGATDIVALDDPATFERVDTLLAARRDLLLSSEPFIENLHLDLWVAIDRDVWLRSIETNVEIYTPVDLGPLRMRVDGDRRSLMLEGTINTDRGEYEFMTRHFQLTRGAVTFLRGEELDAILQVAAEHEVRVPSLQPFEIRALISGTLRAPTVTLESSAQPPISQTDLLTYVVFGQQAAYLMPMQGSALSGRGAASGDLAGSVAALAKQQLATAAFGTLVNDLEGEAARSLGVDVFRITPADLPEELFDGNFADVLEGTEIEMGKYVSPRVFLAAQKRAIGSGLGLSAEYLTPRGFRWLLSWQPRFLVTERTLSEQRPTTTNVLGMFLFRDWRF